MKNSFKDWSQSTMLTIGLIDLHLMYARIKFAHKVLKLRPRVI